MASGAAGERGRERREPEALPAQVGSPARPGPARPCPRLLSTSPFPGLGAGCCAGRCAPEGALAAAAAGGEAEGRAPLCPGQLGSGTDGGGTQSGTPA